VAPLRWRTAALILAAAVPAAAQAPDTASPPAAEEAVPDAAPGTGRSRSAAVEALFAQADFWRAQGRHERVLSVLDRIITVLPNEAEALAQAVDAAAQLGRSAQASQYLQRLRAVAPGDPRVARAEATVTVAGENAELLVEARRLVLQNRMAEAVAQYARIFRNNEIPPFLRTEYLSVLAGSSERGYQQAIEQFRRLSRQLPDDLQLRLAFATQLTYREENRDEGIALLLELQRHPSVAAGAMRALRDAYIWEPPSASLVGPIEALLREYPNDTELQAKLAEARIAAVTQQRINGWEAIAAGSFEQAAARFNGIIEGDPNDAEAVLGLALARGMQGRLDEMRRLRARAIEISPDREVEFRSITEGLDQGAAAAARARAGGGGGFVAPPAASVQAREALDRGQLDRADRMARRAAAARDGDERAQGETILGHIALRRENHPEAERRFRASLALRPADEEASLGLYFALVNQDRFAEADELQRRASFAVPAGTQVRRAFALRDQAARSGSDAEAIATLQEALRLDPGNAFVRLDLGRRLRRVGQRAQARAIETQLAEAGQPEALLGAALLAADEDRFEAAAEHLLRIPERTRSSEANLLLARMRGEAQLRQLEAQARLGDAASRAALMSMASRPDPTGAATASVVRAFGRLEGRTAAIVAARAAMAANPRLAGSGRVALAAALMEARAIPEAEALVAGAEGAPDLSAEDRRQLTFLREVSAVLRAERRTAEGDVAGAWAELAPHLQGSEAAPNVSTALMRAYLRAGRTEDAKQVADWLLARHPSDPDIRASAVDLAVEMREFGRAESLLAAGIPSGTAGINLRLAEARLARARRNPVRELRALEAATRARMEQLRAGGEAQQAALAADLLSPARAPSRLLSDVSDPVTAETLRDLARARDEAATWIQAGAGVTDRSGTSGLSRSTTITAPVEVSMPVRGLQGRLTLQAGGVAMMPGRIPNDPATLSLFGTNALVPGGGPGRPDSTRYGGTVGARFTGEFLRLDAGTTPIGFRRTNLTGGVQVVVPVTQRVNLRLVGERRAVAESLLSYGGQRDALTGQSWGGVTRNGGRIQIEAQLTDALGAYAYAGAALLTGRNVRDNRMFEAGGGLYYGFVNRPDEVLTAGIDYRYMGFSQNLAFNSFGHGGYFSPQRSHSVSLIADYRRQLGDWTLRAVASIGYQTYYARSAPFFPTAGENAAVAALLAAPGVTAPAPYAAQRASGPTGSLMVNAEYALSPAWRLGAAGRYTRSGDYDERVGLIYLRYRLNPASADMAGLLREAPLATPSGSFPFPGSLVQGRPEPVSLVPGAVRPVW
jgi:Tfp pilus assembly protein PilF